MSASVALTFAGMRGRRLRGLHTLLLGSGVGLGGGTGLALASAMTSPLIGAGLAVAAMFGMLMLLSPAAGLMLVAGTIPLERIGRLNEDFSSMTISLSRISGLTALATFLLYAAVRRLKLHFGLAFWLYAGYAFIAASTIAHAFEQKNAIRDSFRILGNLTFFFTSSTSSGAFAWLVPPSSSGSSSRSERSSTPRMTITLAVPTRCRSLKRGSMSKRFTAVVSDDPETRTLGVRIARAYGTTSHPTLFGLNLTLTLPFFAYLMRTQAVKYKLLLFVGMAAIGYGIILSNTRAVMVLAVLAVLTMLAIMARGLWQLNARSIAALAGLAVALIPLIPKDVYLRTFDPALYSTSNSDSIRIRFTLLGEELGTDRTILADRDRYRRPDHHRQDGDERNGRTHHAGRPQGLRSQRVHLGHGGGRHRWLSLPLRHYCERNLGQRSRSIYDSRPAGVSGALLAADRHADHSARRALLRSADGGLPLCAEGLVARRRLELGHAR